MISNAPQNCQLYENGIEKLWLPVRVGTPIDSENMARNISIDYTLR